MAITKNKMTELNAPEEMSEMPLEHCADCCSSCGPTWASDFGRKIMWTLAGVLLVYIIFFVGTLIHNNIKRYFYIGQADQMERTITVTGLGKVSGNNDIALTSIGYSNIDADVGLAQANNKKVMDGILADLKKLGVADKDLQSSYSIYPEYNYTQDKGQELKGYRVSNVVAVKIRNLSKIPAVLALAGKYGANQVNGLSFTIDDPENLKNQARAKALADAEQKASALAARLGVQLVAVVSYNEYDNGAGQPMPMFMKATLDGMGGSAAPEAVASGSQDVVMNVNITYKILPLY